MVLVCQSLSRLVARSLGHTLADLCSVQPFLVHYTPIWSCMVPYGPLWSLWSFMVPYGGPVWSR